MERLWKNMLHPEQNDEYLMDDNSELKKAKRTRKWVIKRRLTFEN